ncbi:PREDICTED: HMG box-containing protein 4-like [Ceratosolen solmsi marchali]|uniref:HMG box-containing protein 4-like n=1 Tax=Ceratosolen solmsi marchali TaxID=326594 RepID=A0AAJ7DT44_9HYME|nr:PREDICTED: HMG box-containing protein 4-like [Ceratosolen solmsi marchali]
MFKQRMATYAKHLKIDESEVTSVSRSGRVCKKSSKLMYFDSTKCNIGNKKKNLSKRYKKIKQSQNTENVDIPYESQISEDSSIISKSQKRCSNTLKKISATNQSIEKKIKFDINYEVSQSSNYETESDSIPSNNGLQTPDYTSYDEDSLYSDEELVISKLIAPATEPKKLVYPNLMVETRINSINEDSVYTGYKLWSTEMKKEILKKFPNMDITIMTIRLGEMWTKMSVSDRNNWHNQAQHLTEKFELFQNKIIIDHERQDWLKSCNNNEVKNFQMKQSHNEIRLRNIQLQPIDVAAYLKLLAESLILIGTRLKQYDKSVIMSDCITVLLDSLLCAMASLICLSQQMSIIKINNFTTFLRTLENIAYIMPGL